MRESRRSKRRFPKSSFVHVSAAKVHPVLSRARGAVAAQMMTNGQLLSQSGFNFCSSGQQDMFPSVPAISSIERVADLDMSAIAFSAAITGAISIPRTASSDMKRTTVDMYFIAIMIGTGREGWKGVHGKLHLRSAVLALYLIAKFVGLKEAIPHSGLVEM